MSVVKTRPVNVPVKEEPLTELGLGELVIFVWEISFKIIFVWGISFKTIFVWEISLKTNWTKINIIIVPLKLCHIVGLWILLKMSTHHLKQHGVTFVLDFYHL